MEVGVIGIVLMDGDTKAAEGKIIDRSARISFIDLVYFIGMRLKIFCLLMGVFFLSGCSLSIENAGVEIMSNPEAKVFIDGIEAGTTPYRNNSLKPKETEIKLIAENGEWTKKIRLQNRTSTVIYRDFDKNGESGGYVLKIEPTGDKNKAGLLVNCRPDRATIKIDGDTRGQSPYKWEDVGVGEKQIDISFPARKKVIVFAKAIAGYQLIIDADLMEEVVVEPVSQLPDVSSQLENESEIVIKTTETGWLRVRGQPNTISAEVGKVNPGEKYKILAEQDGYYEIEIVGGVRGWVSTKYADKILEQDQRIGQ